MLHGTLWDKIPRFAVPVAATAILSQLFNAADIAVIGNFTGELRTVPRECFEPQPKVTSAVLRAVVRREPPVEVEDEKFFFRVVYAAFALRRKTLVNSLMTAFGSQLTKEQVTQAVTSCGLEANIRGERLGLSEFAALSAEIAALL